MWREAIDEVHKPVTAPSLKILNFAGKYNHMCFVFSGFKSMEILVIRKRGTVLHAPWHYDGDLILEWGT